MGNSGISNFSIFQYFPWLGFLMTFEVPSGPHIKCADCVDFYYNDQMILHLLNYICYTINHFSCCICIDHKGGDAYVKSAGTDA